MAYDDKPLFLLGRALMSRNELRDEIARLQAENTALRARALTPPLARALLTVREAERAAEQPLARDTTYQRATFDLSLVVAGCYATLSDDDLRTIADAG